MRILAILRKDLIHQFRNGFGLIMMFVAPLLVTGLIYAAFSGILNSKPQIAQVRVRVADLDQGANGSQLVNNLQGEPLRSLLQVTVTTDPAAARSAVDDKLAEIALIIPANFTRDAAAITLIHDPTLTTSLQIVETILNQYLDSARKAQIAAQTAAAAFAARGLAVDGSAVQGIAAQVAAQTDSLTSAEALSTAQSQSPVSAIAMTAVAMMIFFMFFTGAQMAMTIVAEDEQGTLARLFTTSIRLPVLLTGKLGAAAVVLVVQAAVLLGASAILFGIQWGDLPALGILNVALIGACASFGLLIISLVKTTRQAGTMIGGVLTLTGMLGGLFTAALPNAPAFINAASLVLPQGWAMRGWKVILSGGTAAEVLLPAAALLAIAAACFVLAYWILRKRFA